jgi:hypothetical protein
MSREQELRRLRAASNHVHTTVADLLVRQEDRVVEMPAYRGTFSAAHLRRLAVVQTFRDEYYAVQLDTHFDRRDQEASTELVIGSLFLEEESRRRNELTEYRMLTIRRKKMAGHVMRCFPAQFQERSRILVQPSVTTVDRNASYEQLYDIEEALRSGDLLPGHQADEMMLDWNDTRDSRKLDKHIFGNWYHRMKDSFTNHDR